MSLFCYLLGPTRESVRPFRALLRGLRDPIRESVRPCRGFGQPFSASFRESLRGFHASFRVLARFDQGVSEAFPGRSDLVSRSP